MQREVLIVPEDQSGESQQPTREGEDHGEAIQSPAKVMRIGSMVRQLLEEVRQAPLDEQSRTRLREVYQTAVEELSQVLSDDLREELDRLSPPLEEKAPSESELRVVHAQLVGWLEGLFHGIQAMLFAQQMEARAQFEEMRRRSLPAHGERPQPPPGGQGTYL